MCFAILVMAQRRKRGHPVARKPSFEFERRERTKEKAAKRADKAKVKGEKKSGQSGEVTLVDSSDGEAN